MTPRVERLSHPEDSRFRHPAGMGANQPGNRRFDVASPLMKGGHGGETMALQNIRQKGAAVAAVAGLGALLVGCGSQNPGVARADALNAFGVQQQPMAVSCEPNQRAVVRQVAVNGAFQAQVRFSF